MRIYNAKVYDTENKTFFDGGVTYEDGVITEVIRGECAGDTDAGGAYLLPGLIDVHSHGRGGYDFMSAEPEQIAKCLTHYLRHGITTVFPFVMTAPLPDIYKAIEKYGAKTDIIITTEDSFDHVRTVGGFSIKSHIGSSPTLFNCSSTSGFVYKIVGCDVEGMHRLNYKDGFLDIIRAIKDEYSLEFAGCRNDIFEQNI